MADEEEEPRSLDTGSMPSGGDVFALDKEKVDNMNEPTTDKVLQEKIADVEEQREGEELATEDVLEDSINFPPEEPEIEGTAETKANPEAATIQETTDITNENDPAECQSDPQFLQESMSEMNLMDQQELSSDNFDIESTAKSVPVDIPQPKRDAGPDSLSELAKSESQLPPEVSFDDIGSELPENNEKKASGDITTLIETRHDVSYIEDSENLNSEDINITNERRKHRPRATLTDSLSECSGSPETVEREEDLTIINLLPGSREPKYSYEELIKDESFDDNTAHRISNEELLKEEAHKEEASEEEAREEEAGKEPSTAAAVEQFHSTIAKTSPAPAAAAEPTPESPKLKSTSKKSKWSKFTHFITLGLAGKTIGSKDNKKSTAAVPGATSNPVPLHLQRSNTQNSTQPSRPMAPRPPSAPQPSTTVDTQASGARSLVSGSRFKLGLLASKSKSNNKQDEANWLGNYQDPFYEVPQGAQPNPQDKDNSL